MLIMMFACVQMDSFQEESVQENEKHKGKCEGCNGPLELYEVDYEKKTRILICKRCDLLHFYTPPPPKNHAEDMA